MLTRMVLLAAIVVASTPIGALANCEPAVQSGNGIPMTKDTGVKIGEQPPGGGQLGSGGLVPPPPAAAAGGTNPTPAAAAGGTNPGAPVTANGGTNPPGQNTNRGGTLTTTTATPPTVAGGTEERGPGGERIIKGGKVTIASPGPGTVIDGGATQPSGGGQGIQGGKTTGLGSGPIVSDGGTVSISPDGKTVTASGGTLTFTGGTNLTGEPVNLGPNGLPANQLTFEEPKADVSVNSQFGATAPR